MARKPRAPKPPAPDPWNDPLFGDAEAQEGTKLDAIESAIAEAVSEGDEVYASLLEDARNLWRFGQFPDGTICKRDNTRKEAFKMLQGLVGTDGKRERYDVKFKLDAKVDDPRVLDADVSGMFCDSTVVNVERAEEE